MATYQPNEVYAAGSTVEEGVRRPLAPEEIAVMMAGAHARGYADCFDLMGLAVLFLDADGVVLHANAFAARFMGADIAVASSHLVGATGEANLALQDLIAGAVSPATSGSIPPALIARVDGRGAISVRALRVPAPATGQQLFRAVLVLEEAFDPSEGAAATRGAAHPTH